MAAQDQDTLKLSKWDKQILIGESALGAGTLLGLSSAWYNGNSSHFHAFNDASEWLQLDKVGHFTTSYQIVRINSQILTWSGIPERKALNYSLLQTLAYMTTIEVLDGFDPTYGASFSDLGANSAGALLAYFQLKSKRAQAFTFKYSYRESGLSAYRPALLGKNFPERLLKDYNAQTYWLSINLRDITRIDAIPDWINLAIGYGGTGMVGGKYNPIFNEKGQRIPQLDRNREWSLSFDLNTDRIFKKKRGVNRALRIVSFIKIPLPGIKFSDHTAPEWQLFGF